MVWISIKENPGTDVILNGLIGIKLEVPDNS